MKKLMSRSDGFLFVCRRKNHSISVLIGKSRLMAEAYMTQRRYSEELCRASLLCDFRLSNSLSEIYSPDVFISNKALHKVIAS